MDTDEPNAYDILSELCGDLLDIQIGTLMFWKSEQELVDDHFAEYVHHLILEASRKMGWQHYDSSHVWRSTP